MHSKVMSSPSIAFTGDSVENIISGEIVGGFVPTKIKVVVNIGTKTRDSSRNTSFEHHRDLY